MNGTKGKTFVSPLQWCKWKVDEDTVKKNLPKPWVQSYKWTGSVNGAKRKNSVSTS